MFREQYKGAFNEIKADRSQIDKIFELAEKKPEKKAKIIPFRQVGTLAAAIAIVLVVSLYPNFSEFLKPEDDVVEPVGIVHPEIANVLEDTAITGAAPDVSNEEVYEQNENTAKKSVENKETEQKSIEPAESIKKENTEKTVTEDQTVEETVILDNTHTDNHKSESKTVNATDSAAPKEEATAESSNGDTQKAAVPMLTAENNEDDAPLFRRASGGGSSAAASSLIFAEFPDFGEDKSAAVYAYRENAGISEKIESNAADMGGYKLVTISDDEECRIAYAEKDGVLYQFTATNLTDEEFDKLIGSYL